MFPLEVLLLPDYNKDIFSFHSFFLLLLIEASAAVTMASGRETLTMFCFGAPYILVERASFPQ